MGLEHLAAQIEIDNRRIVEHETWGHLAPEPKKIYPGRVLFTHGAYGDITVIESEFEDLPDSPWFYRALHEHVGNFILPPRALKSKMRGGIWRFEGYCKMSAKGHISFHGKTRPMRVVHRFGRER